MDRSYLKVGAPVVTARHVADGGLVGSGIEPELTKNRRAGVEGTIAGVIPQQGSDVWAVKHKDGSVCAYHRDELVIPKEACMPGGFR